MQGRVIKFLAGQKKHMLFETPNERDKYLLKKRRVESPTTLGAMVELANQSGRHEICRHDRLEVQCREHVDEMNVGNNCMLNSQRYKGRLKAELGGVVSRHNTLVTATKLSCKSDGIRNLDDKECMQRSFKLVQRTRGATTYSGHVHCHSRKQGTRQSYKPAQAQLRFHPAQQINDLQKSHIHLTSFSHNRLLVAILFLLAIFSTSFAAGTSVPPSHPWRIEELETVDLKTSELIRQHREIPDLVEFASRLFLYQLPGGIFGEGSWRYEVCVCVCVCGCAHVHL